MASEIKELPEKNFPPLLTEIPDAPKKLYVRGTLPAQHTTLLCVVGSRKYTRYGKEVCESLISGLAGYRVGIVSGLALGIDSIAHRAALRHGLYTLAIPGSGLANGVLYPRSHVQLAHSILEKGGALLSEFEPDTPATPYTFPQRNRIMAGIAHGILVIEAEEKSGTLITARLGLDYNREVMAVPGPITSPTSAGPHMLIKNGAVPITRGEDIVDALHLTGQRENTRAETLSREEETVCALLHEPMSKDDVINALDIPVSKAHAILSAMEIKGIITEQLGKLRRTSLPTI